MSRVGRFERGVRVLTALQGGVTISRRWLESEFGLSPAQAKRDLDEIERVLPVNRDKGRLKMLRSTPGWNG